MRVPHLRLRKVQGRCRAIVPGHVANIAYYTRDCPLGTPEVQTGAHSGVWRFPVLRRSGFVHQHYEWCARSVGLGQLPSGDQWSTGRSRVAVGDEVIPRLGSLAIRKPPTDDREAGVLVIACPREIGTECTFSNTWQRSNTLGRAPIEVCGRHSCHTVPKGARSTQ